MKSHDRLVRNLKTLGEEHRGSFIRLVAMRYRNDPIAAIGSYKVGGRFNPKLTFEVLYLTKSPDTAAREIGLIVTDETTGKELVTPKEPQMLLTIDASLQYVVDLRNATARTALGVTKRALLGDWRDDVHNGRVPETHTIGLAARAAGVEALISYSAEHAGWNLNIILENLIVDSYVEVYAADSGFEPGIRTRYDGRRPPPR